MPQRFGEMLCRAVGRLVSSDRGVSPKSWYRLIEALKGIKSLTAVTEMIIQDLTKAGLSSCNRVAIALRAMTHVHFINIL